MRKFVKFLHSIASCGLVGALFAYIIVLMFAPQGTPQSYAEMRQTISAISSYILLPSLGLGLVSGLIAMMVHRPFQELRWVWAKAILGLSMFEATLAIIQSKANSATAEATKIADGTGDPQALATIIANEWLTLSIVLALSAAQIGFGIWRPRLGRSAS
ncbi:MAG: DUF2269 family protein [Beijerinckiaceae bacterium]|jgi:hypothetical protein|nr:DUF2269 family protein [Beijerinckiaceae bacterium]